MRLLQRLGAKGLFALCGAWLAVLFGGGCFDKDEPKPLPPLGPGWRRYTPADGVKKLQPEPTMVEQGTQTNYTQAEGKKLKQKKTPDPAEQEPPVQSPAPTPVASPVPTPVATPVQNPVPPEGQNAENGEGSSNKEVNVQHLLYDSSDPDAESGEELEPGGEEGGCSETGGADSQQEQASGCTGEMNVNGSSVPQKPTAGNDDSGCSGESQIPDTTENGESFSQPEDSSEDCEGEVMTNPEGEPFVRVPRRQRSRPNSQRPSQKKPSKGSPSQNLRRSSQRTSAVINGDDSGCSSDESDPPRLFENFWVD